MDVKEFINTGNYGIVAISETWLVPEMDVQPYNIEDYTFFHKDRTERGGGVGLYVRGSFKPKIIEVQELQNGIDTLWVQLKVNKLSLAVGVIYRPPNVSHKELSFLYDILPEILQGCDLCIFTGDLNIDVLCNTTADYDYLMDLLYSFDLTQLIVTPTRVTKTTETALDLVFVNNPDLVKCSGVMPCDPISTDHEAVYCHFDIDTPRDPQIQFEYRNLDNLQNSGLEQFQRDLQQADWHVLYTTEDIDLKVRLFNNTILSTFNKHCSTQKKRKGKSRPGWLTFNLKKIINLKNKAYREFKKSPTIQKKTYYLDLKNYLSTAIKKEKKAFYSSQFTSLNNENNSSEFWNKIKKHNIFRKASSNIPNALINPDVINKKFLTSIPKTTINQDLLGKFNNNTFVSEPFNLKLVTQNDILRSLYEIKSNAIGYDNISARMLKMCVPHCLSPLTNIINSCLEAGTVPELWKKALITPIPKKTNPTIADLRPISILPATSKILEKIVKSQMVQYLEVNNILPKFQSGFRKGYGCSTALLRITSDITQIIDQGGCCPSVLVDMSKAFDSLNIGLLLAKLKFYNLEYNNFFKSYLTGRSQAVRLNDELGNLLVSHFQPVETGVPQGSILGPLLFSVFTADVQNVIKHSLYHMYADDIQIYLPCSTKDLVESVDKINDDLNNISDWSEHNSLLINPQKTQAILFSKNVIETNDLNIHVNGTVVDWQEKVKNLGLYMDINFKFDFHINNICKQAYFKLKTIYEYKYILPEETKKRLTESLVLSIPNYLDIVYGPYLTEYNQFKLQKIQNSCARYVRCVPLKEHISRHVVELFKTNMKQRQLVHMGSMVHKVINTMKPNYLAESIDLRRDCHEVNIRGKNNINIPRHNTEFFKSCFLYRSAALYNRIPEDLKTLGCSHFKGKLRDLIKSGNL